MLPSTKRRPLTTDDLMRRQELGTRKRQKRARDEEEESLRDPGSNSEDPQSAEPSALDESEYDGDSASEIAMQGEEENTIFSRFSFKPRGGTIAEEDKVPPQAHPPPRSFVELGVSSSLVSAMTKMSIYAPTEVQVACIPPLLDGMYFSYSALHPSR